MKNERNYGVDALRILAMLMVVVTHVMGVGGILDACEPLQVSTPPTNIAVLSFCGCGLYFTQLPLRFCSVYLCRRLWEGRII